MIFSRTLADVFGLAYASEQTYCPVASKHYILPFLVRGSSAFRPLCRESYALILLHIWQWSIDTQATLSAGGLQWCLEAA